MDRQEEIETLKALIESGEYLLERYNDMLEFPRLNEINEMTILFNIAQMNFTVNRYKYELEKLEAAS